MKRSKLAFKSFFPLHYLGFQTTQYLWNFWFFFSLWPKEYKRSARPTRCLTDHFSNSFKSTDLKCLCNIEFSCITFVLNFECGFSNGFEIKEFHVKTIFFAIFKHFFVQLKSNWLISKYDCFAWKKYTRNFIITMALIWEKEMFLRYKIVFFCKIQWFLPDLFWNSG